MMADKIGTGENPRDQEGRVIPRRFEDQGDGTFAERVSDGTRPDDFMPVMPDDGADLPRAAIGFSFSGDGDITFVTAAGEDRMLPAGSLALQAQHALRFNRIKATGTTATGIIAYFG